MLYVKAALYCSGNGTTFCKSEITKRANPLLYLSNPCGISQDVVRDVIRQAIALGWFVSIGQSWCPKHLKDVPAEIREAGPITINELDFP